MRANATRKSICIIAFSSIYRDARVLRQIEYLSPHYDLTVVGYGPPHEAWKDAPGVRWVSLDRDPQAGRLASTTERVLRRAGKFIPSIYERWYWRHRDFAQAFRVVRDCGCSAYHANDWETLPLAAEAARLNGARLVFDAHEYGPLLHEENPRWKASYTPLVTYFLRKYVPSVAVSITVAPLIAQRYEQEFGLHPVVILNAPAGRDLPARVLDPQRIGLIHHGNAMEDRHLETMIETMARVDRRYTLNLMLIEHTPGYLQQLRRLADDLAPGRVVFRDPVPPARIVSEIAQFDLGLSIIETIGYNNRVALPNKFFDFVAAGLAVCVGPSPSMVELVQRYGFGCVTPSYTAPDLARVLNDLGVDQLAAMQQAARAARREINADTEMGKLVAIYRELL